MAPKEYDAIQAAAQLKVTWKSDPKLSGSGNYWGWLRKAGDTNTVNPARYTREHGNVDQALASAAKKVSATYKYQYNGHMPIGPQCAVADVRKDGATVFMSGQSINGVPGTVVQALDGVGVELPPAQVRVHLRRGLELVRHAASWLETTEAAAVVSAKIGKPVRMQWMRWDQHGWDPWGPAHMYDVKMGVDANGKIVARRLDGLRPGQHEHEHRQASRSAPRRGPAMPGGGGPTPSDRRSTRSRLHAAGAREDAAALRAARSATARCGRRTRRSRTSPASRSSTSSRTRRRWTRSRSASSNIDGQTITGARWLSVIDGATMAAGWKPRVAASNLRSGDVVTGRGFGLGQFASSQSGVVADIEVTKKTGKIVVKHMYIAQNNGITISPQLVANQMSGAAIQGLSRALYEQVAFTKERITSVGLGHVSDPPLQGQPEGDAGQRRTRASTRSSSRARRTPT